MVMMETIKMGMTAMVIRIMETMETIMIKVTMVCSLFILDKLRRQI